MVFYVFLIFDYIKQYLGRLFNREKQQKWIYSFMFPLMLLWTDFDLWRRKRYYIINITAQVISLEGYLNDTYDTILRRIYIAAAPEGYKGIYVALEQELEPFVWAGYESEGVGVFVGSPADATNNFIVHVPLALQPQENSIVAAVNQFKTSGKGFIVKYF